MNSPFAVHLTDNYIFNTSNVPDAKELCESFTLMLPLVFSLLKPYLVRVCTSDIM